MNTSGAKKRTRISEGNLATSGSFLHREDQWKTVECEHDTDGGPSTRGANRSTSVRSISFYKPSPFKCTYGIVVEQGLPRAILLSIESKCPLMARLLTVSAIMHC